MSAPFLSSTDRAYNAGQRAAAAGQERETCPHVAPYLADLRAAWLRGFDDAAAAKGLPDA